MWKTAQIKERCFCAAALRFFPLFAVLLATSANADATLKVGVRADAPPCVFKDYENKLIGYDIDVLQEIGTRLAKKIDIYTISWDQKTEALDSRKIDVIAGALTVTDKRKKNYAYTIPIASDCHIAVVAISSPIQHIADLGGKKICLMQGATAIEVMQNFQTAKGEKVTLQPAPSIEDCLLRLETGEIEIAVIDGSIADYYINHNPKQFRTLPEKLSERQTAFGLRKNETALRDQFDKALTDMENDGTMKTIRERWFGKDK